MDTSSTQLSPHQRVERERNRRLLMDADEQYDAQDFFLSALRKTSGGKAEIPADIVRALRFAAEIDYRHEGVSPRVYLKHPLRVATLLAEQMDVPDAQAIITALLHNVLEVSDIAESKLQDVVGTDVTRAIKVLTVDRSLQYDAAYKEEYYRRIEDTSDFCAQVKVADKLDNIYMLCFNPSADIRHKYLDEIDRWVVPMAHRVIPVMGDRIAEASIIMRETGYLAKDIELERARRMQVQ